MRVSPFVLLALLMAACANTPPATDTFVSPSFIAPPRGSVVVILPPQSRISEFASGADVLEAELERQISSAGFRPQLVSKSDFGKIWREEVSAVGGLYDPASGGTRVGKYEQALSALARRISADIPGALILCPRLLLRTARLSGTSVEWDGQSRQLPAADDRAQNYRWEGETQGLSVELMAIDASGNLQFKTYGALLVPYRVNIAHAKNEIRDDLFHRHQDIVDGATASLRPLLSP
jgi:hypothetical protein